MEFSKEIDKLTNPIELKWNGTTHKVFKTFTSLEKWVNEEKDRLQNLQDNIVQPNMWMYGRNTLQKSINSANALERLSTALNH